MDVRNTIFAAEQFPEAITTSISELFFQTGFNYTPIWVKITRVRFVLGTLGTQTLP
jgi:hypothetical protein